MLSELLVCSARLTGPGALTRLLRNGPELFLREILLISRLLVHSIHALVALQAAAMRLMLVSGVDESRRVIRLVLGDFGQVLVDSSVVLLLLRVLVTLSLLTRAAAATLILGLILEHVSFRVLAVLLHLSFHAVAMATFLSADRVLLHLFERFPETIIVTIIDYLHLSAVSLLRLGLVVLLASGATVVLTDGWIGIAMCPPNSVHLGHRPLLVSRLRVDLRDIALLSVLAGITLHRSRQLLLLGGAGTD